MPEEYTNIENYYQEFDTDNSNIEVDNISNLYNENIEEEAVPEILQDIEVKEFTSENTVIEKIFKYIKSPIREDSAEIIESMIELSSSLESMSVESIELSKLLNESERVKLDLLKEMSKRGLNTNQYPLGKAKKEQINPVAFVFETDTKLNSKLKNFGTLLEELATNSDLEFKKNVIKEKKEFEELEIDIKKYVLNQQQKKGYFQILLTSEDDRLTRTELDFMINFMKNSNFKNLPLIKEREKFYKSLLNDEEVDFPDVSELIKDVSKLKGILNHKLEDLPEILTAKEKENFKNFLPALDEYYKDQVCALSGGKSFVPLTKSLIELQKEINDNPNTKILIDRCEILGYSQQRLYILHWIAESLMKEKYNTTLGKAIINYSNNNPRQRSKYNELFKAVRFRNDIAHNGLLWNPEDFEKYIKAYENGIKLISEDLNINLEEYKLKKQNRNLTVAEKKEEMYREITRKTNLKTSSIDKIGIDFTKNEKMRIRLYEFVNILKEKEISIQKLIDENIEKVIEIIKSEDKINFLINREFNNNFFKDQFAKEFFNMSYAELEKRALNIQANGDKWVFKLYKTNDISGINQLKAKINAR